MEFFLGAFERDWERRRAALLHELQMGEQKELDWGWRRKGGVAGVSVGDRDSGGGVREQGHADSLGGAAGRKSMRSRFVALARGSQPAVVKLASYGSGVRAAAMMSYASRSGQLPVENEKGNRIVGHAVLAELRAEWENLFDNREASRDVGVFEFKISLSAVVGGIDRYEFSREIVRAGFGERRFVFAIEEKNDGELEVRGVVVLRDPSGERLTADAKATAIVQERVVSSLVMREADVRFRFGGYGNGVNFATARVRELIERVSQGQVRDETGRIIEDFEEAGDLVQKEWRRELHSRKGRDVMHLVVSARAGTDLPAFQAAVRDFLGEQFGNHRYILALHDPADDPKEVGRGGRRPHVHAHAIVTMRSDTGERVVTSPLVFRQWRALMAEKAREHGINMEMTDRREFASPPAYARNQVRPVSYAGRTEHKGTSNAAQIRYDGKRANRRSATRSERSVGYALTAVKVWDEIKQSDPREAVLAFATAQIDRLESALRESRIDIDKVAIPLNSINLSANVVELGKLVEAGGPSVRAMTRQEFVAYEDRVEALLANVVSSLNPAERTYFGQIAASAREIVNIRREYLELTERQPDADADQRNPAVQELPWRVGLRSRERRTQDEVIVKGGRYQPYQEGFISTPTSGDSKSIETDRPLAPGGMDARTSGPLPQDLPDGSSSGTAIETERSASGPGMDRTNEVIVRGHTESVPEATPTDLSGRPGRDREGVKAAVRRPQEGRPDSPQQQVPRLQELERDVDERQHGRDGRER